MYEGYDPELKLEFQVDCMYDKWEWDWSFHEMSCDYNEKHPDLVVSRYMEGECDGGGVDDDDVVEVDGKNVDASN